MNTRQLLRATSAAALVVIGACSDSSSPNAVSTITVAPNPVNVIVGESTQLSATLRNSSGETVSGTVTWSMENGGIANVTSGGLLQGLAAGQTVVRARSGGKTGTATVTVGAVAAASVTINPDSVNISLGSSQTLSAVVRDAGNNVLVGRTIVWTTSDPNVAIVSQTGVVTTRGLGRAEISATADGITGKAVVRVEVTAGDFTIQAQWTQATQSVDGSIPMILGGNGAAVNVLVSSSSATSPLTQILLRLTNASGAIIRAETLAVSIPPNANPTLVSPTVQFRLQPSDLIAGMRWQVVRDPKGLVPDASAETDVYPREGPQALPMVTVPLLKVRFVPIVLTAHNNTTGNVNAGNIGEYTRTLESALPIGALDATVGANFSTSQSFGTPPDQGGFALTFWNPILQQLDIARVGSEDPSTYWIGVVLPPAGFNRTNNGGIGYVPGSGTGTGLGTRTNMVTSFGWASDPAFTRNTVAHELGHNFGRPHAPCGLADNADPQFPYTGGLIGVPGHDVRGWMAGRTATAVGMPPTFFDLMGYCTPGVQNWLSDYNYRTIMNFRGFNTAAGPPVALKTLEPRRRVLLVSGSIDRTNGITLNPTFTLDARPARPEQTGPYHVEGRSASGSVLFAYDFAPSVIDHAPDAGHFAFAVPMSPATESQLAVVNVRGPAGTARIERSLPSASLRAPGDFAPRRSAGMVTVGCEDPGARGMIVRDANGITRGISMGSTARVSVDPGTQLEVVCSDGLRSARRLVISP